MTNHIQATTISGPSPISTNTPTHPLLTTLHRIRLLTLTLLMLLGICELNAQTANNAYVFYNATYGYLVNNGGNPGVNTTFNKNAIWVANNTMGNTSRNVSSYTDNSKFFRGTAGTSNTNNGSFTLGNSENQWQIRNNYLNRANNNRGYVRYNGTGFILNSSTTNQNFTGLRITINEGNPSNPTVSITAAAGLSNDGIQLSGSVTGSYTPAYYYASVRNYNNNNTQTYYWTQTTDATTTQPTGITDWSDATKTWAVTTGATYASVSSDGLVTIIGNPTGNIVVTLTVTKGGYTGTQTFTLTRTAVTQSTNTVSTINSFTVSPGSAALYVNGSQAFTASATVNTTTYNTPAHTKLTNGDNTYYYYNGTLYSKIEDFSSSQTTTATPTFAWSMTGEGSGNASLSATSGANSTVTHSIGVTADKALTLNVEASYTGATAQTKTAQVTLYAPFVAPTITRSGNNISLSTYSLGATIYYTTDGSTPSASNGSVYSAPFSLEQLTLPVTVKAIAIRGGESTSVAQETYSSLSLDKPVISISSTGTVTISCSNADASIRYTTDGTNPTSSSGTVFNGSFNVSNLTTVKAIAYKDGYADSEIAEQLYAISGTTSGGLVILNDFEDHNWSYYQPASELPDGYPDRMRSPYPRNVKITYYGYGDNTLSTSEVPTPAANTFDTNTSSTDVKVGIGEDGNTFIYFKTLERDANNRFPYEMIPNPFYVRPKSGTTYTGFYKWRIKSITNGAVFEASSGGTALSIGSMLDAETTYYFQPIDNAWTNANNATSMEIELEALWAPAEISTGNTPSFSKGYNSVERNFYVGSGGLFSSTTPCTYSSFYPNGTTNGTTAATLNDRVSKATGTAKADSKVEYMTLSGNTTNADAYNLTLGRGIGGSGGTFYPVNASKNVDINFRLRLESGSFGTLYLMADGTNNKYQRFQNHFTFGSDYDRAKEDNSKLTVAQGNAIKNGNSEFSEANKDKPTLTCIIKSGEYQSNYWTNNNNAQYNYGFYCCQDHDNASYPGLVSLTVEGGHFASIIGGRGNYTEGCITQDSLSFTLRFKGGLVDNSIYGASSNNATYGSRRLIFTGGEVRGWIAAGCNGTSDTDQRGQTRGDSYVYVGGNTKVGNADVPRTNNSAVGGNIFGAGRGGNQQYASIKTSHVVVADNAEVLHDVFGGGFHGHIVYTSNVFILGGTTHGNVFGGGDNNSGDNRSIPTVNIYMTGGLVEGGIYGGSNENGIVSTLVNMHIDGGQVGTTSKTANIHGGGLGLATRVNGDVELTLGTTTQTTPGVTVYGDVYGGSALGYVNGTTAADTYHTYVTLNKGVINGSLYGGGLGAAGTAAHVYGPVEVKVYGGSVKKTDANGANGSGGVYGANNVNGAPQRSVTVDIYGTDTPAEGEYALFAVYGGGNQAAYTYGHDYPTVTVHNCNNSIEYVYGGGNAAAVASTDVTIYGGDVIGNVFGGGNGTGVASDFVMVTGNATTKIYGGTIRKVFAGNNSNGLINGNVSLTINKQIEQGENLTLCDMKIGEVYGGGNLAKSKVPNYFFIGCTGALTSDHAHANIENNIEDYRIGYDLEGIGSVYGGANQADVTSGDISLAINSGIIANVFGGNNQSGNISGTIKIDINKTSDSDDCGWYVGNVFGGGNLARYTGSPKVNILNGTVSGNVYGGGKGDSNDHTMGQVTGNPVVTIGDADNINDNGVLAEVKGDVYGGGDAGNVVGTPVVNVINKCNTTISNVYGGGNAADVSGTDVNINGGIITGMVFGGGHGDKNSTPTKEANVNGPVAVDITGGTINKVFGGSNSKGNITGNVAVNIAKGTNSCDLHITEVYGGGNEAAGNAGNINIGCTGDYVNNGEGIKNVYGGANAADIGNDIILTISGGHIDSIYGGNNTSGSINGTITVQVNWDDDQDCDKYLGYVFGGGNKAFYNAPTATPNYPQVNIVNGAIAGNVYGGGLGETATVTGNPRVTLSGGNITGKVFGGGEAAPVIGNPVVTASGDTVKAARLYGGGLGSTAIVTGNTEVNVSNGTYGYVFGGGEAADMTGSVTINISGGTITNDVYGGGALANTNTGNLNTSTGVVTLTDSTIVNLTGGTIANAYGGGLGDADIAAKVYGNVKVYLNKGVASGNKGCVVTGKLFGCNNINGTPLGNATVHVFGTQNAAASSIGDKSVTPFDFDIQAIYGGGNMAAYIPYSPAATANVIVQGCGLSSIGYVYGGGNAAPVPATNVTILGSDTIYSVFGGGNGKDSIIVDGVLTANPGADVGIHLATTAEYNDAANASLRYIDSDYTNPDTLYLMYGDTTGTSLIGTTHVTIMGGTIAQVFGGSNTKGDIIKDAIVILGDEDLKTCEFKVAGVYGGSNEAYMSGSAGILMNCVNGLAEIYGGSKMADVHKDIVLTINGGHYGKVFGGNNISGRIYGSITVNIEQTGCLPIVIDELYGGGNQAAYSVYGYDGYTPRTTLASGATKRDDPQINIISCDSIGTVFGGGLGKTAIMVGSPHINIDMVKGWTNGNYKGTKSGVADAHAQYKDQPKNMNEIGRIGNVFGGGNAANVIGNTHVNIGTKGTVKVHNITKGVYDEIKAGRSDLDNPYGALDDDDVTNDLTITVEGANITGNVYGGGNQAHVTGQTNVQVGPTPAGSHAPIRSSQPANEQAGASQAGAQSGNSTQSNAATESTQSRTVTPNRAAQ